MSKFDDRVDLYIEKSADFAKPILTHIRKLVHKALPEVEETMKWSFPHFDYKGSMCNMAAFKQHCTFGFWKASLMSDSHKLFDPESAMGHIGKITSLKDLPSDKIMIEYIKEAAKLNEEGVKVKRAKPAVNKDIVAPAYFTEALGKNKKALKAFDDFTPGQKKEYIEWITEAKTEATKDKRMTTAIEWISEGKTRHWKYKK